jgi:protein O-GlcNAc transferase
MGRESVFGKALAASYSYRMTLQTLSDEAVRLHQQGRLAEAEQLYLKILEQDPGGFTARHFLGVLRLQQGRNEEALQILGEALKLNPGSVEALINYGNALKLCARHEEALASFDRALALRPDYSGAPYNRAILLADLGRNQEALESYGKALVLQPDFIEALRERALLLHKCGKLDEALVDFDRLLARMPGFAAGWSNRGVVLEDMERLGEALASHEKALAIDPAMAEALHNRGAILMRLRRFEEALTSIDRSLAIKPDAYSRVWNNRGALMLEIKNFPEAMASFNRALAIDPNDVGALQNRGRLAWLEFRNYGAARADLERAAQLDPDYPDLLGDLLYLKMIGGDWGGRAELAERITLGVRAGKKVVRPFIYQAISDCPADLAACSVIHVSRFPAAPPMHSKGARRPGKIRVGYVSGEFRQQATAWLAAGLYECHDREKFELFAFDSGVGDGSAIRRRLEAAFDKFVPIAGLPDQAAAARIADEEIDILVNLNGYFGEQRPGLFAHKPAPIQVNYLGFPMTLGAAYMDYIVADRCVIPEEERRHFSEKTVYLPDSYQVNDSRRAIDAKTPTRAECGLPSAFVFCNFNQAYKLTPEIFARWMAILKQVPGSVLWLLEDNSVFAENVRAAGAAAGLAPGRIVFAPQMQQEKHLARLKLADLSLDTLPYNAHTTASDALWAGLPILTCRGKSFSGRVAASLLAAIGLAELVTEDLDAYEALAVELARQPERLASLRHRLAENRLTWPLFDTARYARRLEAAFAMMVERREKGLAPESFSLPQGQ